MSDRCVSRMIYFVFLHTAFHSFFISTNIMMTGVSIIAGPVIGLVTQTSVNILVEVPVTTEITLNVFVLSNSSNDGRFISKQVK